MNIGTGQQQVKAAEPMGFPVAPAYGNQDYPPDMIILLQKLEEDFANKTIDQWSYINRREEIIKLVNRLKEKKNNIQLQPEQLEDILLPRKLLDFNTFAKQSLMSILRERAAAYKTEMAFLVLDSRGKELHTISWESYT
ncbi:CIC11C00000001641 [Sungouiella intermedia]|uniref:CIC11C00000001641 n=1 Tax=Sungouiella intermedia TaxID=45354 RepID=A0A1L0GD65_9ASCO|nr:CIC11C00000001641 [[Candida] intermedia]